MPAPKSAVQSWEEEQEATLRDLRDWGQERVAAEAKTVEAGRAEAQKQTAQKLTQLQERLKLLSASPKPPKPAPDATQINGTLVLEESGDALPGLRFRIVGTDGKPLLEKPEWATDEKGRFRLDFTERELKGLVGDLRIEVLDPQGSPVHVIEKIPRVPAGQAVKLEVKIAGRGRQVLADLAAQSKLEAESAGQQAEVLKQQIAALKGEEAAQEAEFEATLERLRESQRLLQPVRPTPVTPTRPPRPAAKPSPPSTKATRERKS
jgi:hypothetical protein